jgi:hypothetical protein
MGSERRRSERHDLDDVAYIEGVRPCVVMEVSKTGARLQLSDERFLPENFMITLSPELQRWCQIKWRSADQIGVQFISCPFGPFRPVCGGGASRHADAIARCSS